MLSRIWIWVSAALFAVVAASTSKGAEVSSYRLGPEDHLKLRVYDWRAENGQIYEWAALTGEFVVGASGYVSLPIVGELPARDQTTAELADTLKRKLQVAIGLARPPFASIEVIKYRPFYIIGMVEKPGEYAFRPRLTILQAVGIAGGFHRATEANLLGYERDALVSRGDLRALSAERDQLKIKQARLAAAVADVDLELPDDMAPRRAEPAIVNKMREEAQILETYRTSIATESSLATQNKTMLKSEIETLEKKSAVLDHQLDSARRELDLTNGLVNRGLVIASRQIALMQNVSQYESAALDVKLAIMRAKEDIWRTDRDLSEMKNKVRAQALNEASSIRERLATIDEKIVSAERLIVQSEVRAPDLVATQAEIDRSAPKYTITRVDGNGRSATFDVADTDYLLPGDTIRVRRLNEPEESDVSLRTKTPLPGRRVSER